MKIDAKECAKEIIDIIGNNNIQTVSHCMTRLRFSVKDINIIDQEKIKTVKGVLGVVYATGQLQVIMGQNLLPVYEEVIKLDNFNVGQPLDENPDEKQPFTIKNAGSAVLKYVSASVTPLVPGLIAGGMLKVVLLLITLVSATFSETQTYQILSFLANAPFYFMPIFVAYGASKKLGSTPIYAMLCSAALLAPEFITMVGSGEAIYLFGLPVKAVGYSNSLIPALLIALAAYHLEKLFNKIVPGIFKSIFVGLETMVVTMTLGFVVLGPLGNYIGAYLAYVFVWLGNTVGPVALGVLAACLPWLLMCGMHTAFGPFMAQAIADPGYDPVFRPAFILHNMAEGGACIGVALRTKNREFRSECLSIAFGCIVAGVSEPAIYGINLRLRKPMYGVMAGGAIGGIVAGILGVRAYVMGYSTILALPIFEETVVAMLFGIIVCIIAAAVVTFVLGFEEDVLEDKAEPAKADTTEEFVEVADEKVVAVSDGSLLPLNEVKDEVFASGVLGYGVAFNLEGDTIVSPSNGTLSVMFPTGHAFGITTKEGKELLVHIGIDTVKLNGKGFTTLATQGSEIKAGQPVVKLDMEVLGKAGYDLTTMLIVSDDKGSALTLKNTGKITKGSALN